VAFFSGAILGVAGAYLITESANNLKGGAVAKNVTKKNYLPRGNFTIKDIDTVCKKNSKKYSCEDGVLFNSDKTVLLKYAINNTNTTYEIPNTVTTIGDVAFEECTSLTSIIIPNSVKSIGYSSFGFCDRLISIIIPNSVESIENSAFQLCTKLKTITFSPDSKLKTISDSAFSGLFSLTSFTIPDSVTTIERAAFQADNSLIKIIIPNSVTSIGKDAFSDCDKLTTIVIPSELITTINVFNIFSGCKKLTNIKDETGKSYKINYEGKGKEKNKFVLI